MALNVNGTTITAVNVNGVAMTKVVVNGTTVWQSEPTVFSSTVTRDGTYNTLSRTGVSTDTQYVSSVSNVLNLTASNGTGNTKESSEVIFTPTALAKSSFAYALVTVKACSYANYGTCIAKAQDTTLINKGAGLQDTVTQTIKIPLSSIGTIYAYAKNDSSEPTYTAKTAIAVEKIVLTNS